MSLVPVDTGSAPSVITLLEQCKTWLTTAVEQSSPQEIALVKAQVATAAEATKQLDLSKEIQLDAQEMVRRAEYALGKAIRKGQAEGTIRKPGDDSRVDLVGHNNLVSASSIVSKDELYGNGAGVMHLAEVDEAAFEEAVDSAKAEKNLSRANLVRKVQQEAGPVTRAQRADLILELAAQGYSSRQMPAKVGVTEITVRRIAREHNIEIPADRTVSRTRRMDSTHIVTQTVTALEGLASGIDLIDYDAVNIVELSHWLDSLTDSFRVLNRFHKQIKELSQ